MNLFSLIWSNLFRRKVRTFLTIISVLVAFLLFTLLRTIVGAFSGEVNIAGVDRLTVLSKYSIIELLPISHMAEIERIEGVDSVAHQTFFGGSYQEINNFFFKFPVRPREYFAMYSEFEIQADQLDAFERTRNGAVVPVDMAERYGWQIGDNIPIVGDIWVLDSQEPWIFQLVGTYSREGGESSAPNDPFMMHFDYFDEGRPEETKGSVGWFTVKVTNPDNAAIIAAQIDSLFENSRNPTRTATEAETNRQFVEQLGDIGLMMNGILSAVFFTILLLTGNTMSQSFRERIPELAVLKTFGFTDMTVSFLVLAESVTLCVLGGALGIGLAALISESIRPQIESFISPFLLTSDTILLGFAIAVGLGLVVGVIPAITAKRLQIVDALRE